MARWEIGEKKKRNAVRVTPVYILMIYTGATVLHDPILRLEPILG